MPQEDQATLRELATLKAKLLELQAALHADAAAQAKAREAVNVLVWHVRQAVSSLPYPVDLLRACDDIERLWGLTQEKEEAGP